MRYRLSPRAADDLKAIIDYISDRNPSAAERLVDRLEERWRLLVEQPRSGAPRKDLGLDSRNVVVGEYLSIYRIDGNEIEIVRVLHGRRDISSNDLL